MYVNRKEIYKFNADNGNANFQNRFCLESISDGLSLGGNVYDFSVDHNTIDKSDILHIQKHLMIKNNIK